MASDCPAGQLDHLFVRWHARTLSKKSHDQEEPNTPRCHWYDMQRTTLTTTILAAATIFAGCGAPLNPCQSALYLGLDADEQAACDMCDDYKGCEAETGETGDDFGGLLSCSTDGAGLGMPFCVELDTTTKAFDYPGYTYMDEDDCGSKSMRFPHVASWADPFGDTYDGQYDVWCSVEDDRPDLSPSATWNLCRDSNGGGVPADGDYFQGYQEVYPATLLTEENPSPEWSVVAGCQEYTDQLLKSCSAGGLVAVGGGGMEPHNPEDWTCGCRGGGDVDCPGTMICEAGFYFEGMFPTPTLCSFPDGTPNGSAPEGPLVYGLSAWEDGIIIEGSTIQITTVMLLEMTNNAALWDDGQRFDVFDLGLDDGIAKVEFTACDPAALCGHLGLGVGDQVHVPVDGIESLEMGVSADVLILRDGEPEYWTIEVSDT